MGTIRRQSIQATMLLALGVLIGFVLKLFVFTAYLTPAEIGLLTVLLDSANLFAAFIPLGSQAIFIKYMPYFKPKDQKSPSGLLFIGGTLALIGFFIFLVFFLFFKDSIIAFYADQAPMFSEYIIYLLPLVAFRVYYSIGQAYAWALKKNIFPLFIKEILVRILTGIVVLSFAWHWFDIDGLVFWFVAIYFVSGAVITFYLSRNKLVNLSKPGDKLANGKGKEILFFGLFAIMTSAGDVIIRNVDSLMITSLVNLSATGIYSIAFFIGQIIEMPRRAVSQITAPFIAEASANDDYKQISKLYQKTSLNQFIVGSLLLICVWINIDSLLEIIPNGEDYVSGKYVVLFIGLGKLFDMSMGVNGAIIQQSKYYRFNFYAMALMGVIGIITNLTLIPSLGINGAAIASLVTFVLANVIRGTYLSYRFKFHPFTKNFGFAIILFLCISGVGLILPSVGNPILDIIFRSIVIITLYGASLLGFKISDDFNNLFGQILKRFGFKGF